VSQHEAHFALYGYAHHDLWWAKGQQWNVANWTILLLAGLVGVDQGMRSGGVPDPATARACAVLVWFVTLIAGVYLMRLHRDVLHNRSVYRALEKNVGADKIRQHIPQIADERSDDLRGLEHLLVLVAAIAVATFFALELLGRPGRDAFPQALFIGLANTCLVLFPSYVRIVASPMGLRYLPRYDYLTANPRR